MVESYFKSAKYISELREAPLGKCIRGFSSELARLGYARNNTRRILWKIGQFNKYAKRARIEGPEQINEKLISGFIIKTAHSRWMVSETRRAINHFLKYLSQRGPVQPSVILLESPFDELLSRYDRHMFDVRGLASCTRESYLRGARRLEGWLRDNRKNKPLKELTGPDVLEFVTELVGAHPSASWRHHVVGETRAFIRYLQWEGIIKIDLARVVPPMPCRRLTSMPRHLGWDQVRKVIANVNTDSPIGKRDKAILLLLAMLGFRNQEVRKLRLEDIDWRAGKVHLLKTKNQRERVLPLGQEVGEAIADYLLHGRPHSKLPFVFLRHMTPVGAISSTHGVSSAVQKHLKLAGIPSPSYGAHILRHSLATHLVNRDVPIKDIADVLGHASIDTTAIYTKVNHTQLATVARAFPGEAL